MNILILGLNSYVGYYFAKELEITKKTNWCIFGVARNKVEGLNQLEQVIGDSLNEKFLEKTLSNLKIDIIVNCVSKGIVDDCEKDPDSARLLNYDYVMNLVNLCNKLSIKLLHFSTNAVYDGLNAPYNEESIKNGQNIYGQLKAQADEYIKQNSKNYLILRPITLFGPKKEFHRNNPVSLILNFLNQNKDMKLVNDVYGNLLYIFDFAKVIRLSLENDLSGEYNISGDRNINRFELGVLVKMFLPKCSSHLLECTSEEFPSPAPRAPDTSFDNKKIKDALNFSFTELEEAVQETIVYINK